MTKERYIEIMSLISIARFGIIPDSDADDSLERWGHYLGGCDRPFGRINYGLYWEDDLVAVAVSASTPNQVCARYDRKQVVELARLCSHPEHRDLTRVMLRMWRKSAATDWNRYWPVIAYVSYSNAARHSGDVYRFDGWKKIADVRGGVGGGRSKGKRYEAKSIWAYPLSDHADGEASHVNVAVSLPLENV